jgi:hypothetical protein
MHITMTRYGDHGWEFTVDGRGYRTNRMGEGLWFWGVDPGSIWPVVHEYRQEQGTCQFSLSQQRARAYQQIRRRFTEEGC